MSKRYESAKDIEAQIKAKKYLEKKFGWELSERKAHDPYGGEAIDFAILVNGHIRGYLEYKRRYNNSDKYETIFLDVKKLEMLRNAASSSECTLSFLVVEWDDKMGMLQIPSDFQLNQKKYEGRFGRSKYECHHIPVSSFEDI